MAILFFLLGCVALVIIIGIAVVAAYWAVILTVGSLVILVTFAVLSKLFGDDSAGAALIVSIPIGLLAAYGAVKMWETKEEVEAKH
jgi:hypothetical protein